MIADAQALTDNATNPSKVRNNVIEVMLDYLAVGLNPTKTTFFIQSEIVALPELTAYFMNLVSLPRLLRNPTVRRSEFEKKIPEIIKVLKNGTAKANKVANQTLLEVKKAMGIDYFSNNQFEEEQTKRYSTKQED